MTATPAPRRLAALVAEVVGRSQAPNTRRAYASDLSDFFQYLLGPQIAFQIPIADSVEAHAAALHPYESALLSRLCLLSEGDINAYIAAMSPAPNKAGRAAATIARRLTPLRLLFARLRRHQFIALDPTADVRGPRRGERSTTVYLSREEVRRLEAACAGPSLRDLRDLALIRLMVRSGLRAREVCNLDLDDIRPLAGHTVAWVRGKGGVPERVKVAPAALSAIQAYLDTAGIVEGAVFRRVTYVGRPVREHRLLPARLSYAGLKHALLVRCTAAGLCAPSTPRTSGGVAPRPGISPHSLRHTFITLALKGGASIAQAQAAARHRSPETTIRYAHDLDDLDDNAVDYVHYD
jgi:integrase/recombinase XerD